MDINSLWSYPKAPVKVPADEVDDGPDWRRTLERLQELEAARDEVSAARRADAVVERFLRALGHGAIANHWRRVRERAR